MVHRHRPQSTLTMLSENELRTIIRGDSAWAGVHTGTAQLLADTLLNESFKQAWTESL